MNSGNCNQNKLSMKTTEANVAWVLASCWETRESAELAVHEDIELGLLAIGRLQ